MNIVDKIKDLCISKGITLTELEREINIGRGVIRKWDTAAPNSDKLQKVSDYFHVSTDYLLGIEKPVKPQVHVIQRAADGGLNDTELDDILSYAKFKYPERFK